MAATDERATEAAGARGEPLRPRAVVGFGNPGSEYAQTRHNVGAWCVRVLARWGRAEFERHGKVETATIDVDGRALHVLRPRAYVNESGPPVAAELRRLRVAPGELLALYDELDLPVGQLRMRLGGGHGGHNGMRSLIAALGGGEFARVRVGIDRPYDDGRPVREPERVADWVLARPSAAEREALDAAVERAADAVLTAVREGVEVAMNRFNPAEGGTGRKGGSAGAT